VQSIDRSMMPSFRNLRWCLLAVLAGFLLMAVTGAPAWASYGELSHFSGVGTNTSAKGTAFILEGEEAHAFAVDPDNGSIYVGDEGKGDEEELRIQQYSASGAYEAAVTLKKSDLTNAKVLPKGIENVESFDGFAVDAAEGRLYVLVTYRRGYSKVDADDEVAGALYAFKTTPEGGVLVPAEGTSKEAHEEGLLGTTTALEGNSETAGQALLEPAGIAVNPKTHEIVILGEVEEGEFIKHVVLDRVNNKGELLGRYLDPEDQGEEPDSPVVTEAGRIFYESGDEILQVPAAFESTPPKEIFTFEEPEGFETDPFKEEMLEFDEGEYSSGGALAISPEGAGTGRLVSNASVWGVNPEGTFKEETLNSAVLTLKYAEEGENTKVEEVGWTGGVPGPGDGTGEPLPCQIGSVGNYPLVAATSDEGVAVLAGGVAAEGGPKIDEVIKFGPGGTGCPTAKETASGLEATVEGTKVTTVDNTNTVALSADVQGADVRSVEWKFGSEGGETITVAAGEEIQVAETSHIFAKPGKEVAVEAVVHTDDLATPEITFKTKLNVDEAPIIKPQPKSTEVFEGENAEFKAEAEGEPAPTVQWEVSKDKGAEWNPVTGATKDVLTVSKATTSESGYEYRAIFKNAAGTKTSEVATLTVKAVGEKVPVVTKNPSSETVLEGNNAEFKAEVSGIPTPTVQWEVSTDEGKVWSALSGETSDTLTVLKVTFGENKYEYRAAFTNTAPGGSTPVYSAAATLTVETKAQREQKEKEQKEKEQKEKEQKEKEQKEREQKEREQKEKEQKEKEQKEKEQKEKEQKEKEAKQETNPDATLASTSLSVSSSGALSIKVSCPAGTTCTGTITLRTLGAVSARISARAAKKSILTLATGSFTVAGGQSKTVTLHLSGAARKLLARSHVLRARATIVAHDLSGASHTTQATVTLRPAKAKPHH
jgi:hypothetical protein